MLESSACSARSRQTDQGLEMVESLGSEATFLEETGHSVTKN